LPLWYTGRVSRQAPCGSPSSRHCISSLIARQPVCKPIPAPRTFRSSLYMAQHQGPTHHRGPLPPVPPAALPPVRSVERIIGHPAPRAIPVRAPPVHPRLRTRGDSLGDPMAKEELIEMGGLVTEVLPDSRFR